MILTITMNPAIDKIYFVKNFQLGEVHRPVEMIASAGGKGLNVARVIHYLGEKVAASGFLGGGNGDFISQKIKDLSIDNRFVNIEQETRICINVTDSSNQLCTEVLEAGPCISQEEKDLFLKKYEAMIEDVELITISGSLPEGLPASFYYSMITVAHKRNKKVLLDTSGKAFLEGIKAKPFLVKPNMDEIKNVYNQPMNTEEDWCNAIHFLKEEGIEIPVISLGENGCIAGLKDGIYKVDIPPIQVINTVGSGDSFIGGFAVGLVRNLNDCEILRLASATGSANTQFNQTGYVEQEVVNDFLSKITVRKMRKYSS
ncbi:1-phosphofructokinase [Vallitalea okinawensis]|uniref:1-phosphofructokinase n=1 Tax=Vallitalea okinawensis TaxID=2078660 RepID=UPI000CFB958C|nr:1-phosphofructokinase [Vallitalea okinawensis]